VPSFILIHLTVWPQCTNVTDMTDRTGQTDRTDNGPIAYRANRFTNGRPKSEIGPYKRPAWAYSFPDSYEILRVSGFYVLFSERELTFTRAYIYAVARPSVVCRA